MDSSMNSSGMRARGITSTQIHRQSSEDGDASDNDHHETARKRQQQYHSNHNDLSDNNDRYQSYRKESNHSTSIEQHTSSIKSRKATQNRFKPPARLQQLSGHRDLMAMAAASSSARDVPNGKSRNSSDDEKDDEHDYDDDDEDLDARLAAYEAAAAAAAEYNNYLQNHEERLMNDRWDSGSSHHKNSNHTSMIRRSSSHDDDEDNDDGHNTQSSSRYHRGRSNFPKEISTPSGSYHTSVAGVGLTPTSSSYFSNTGVSDIALMSTSHHTRFHQQQSYEILQRKQQHLQQQPPEQRNYDDLSNYDNHHHRRSAPRSPVRKKSASRDEYTNPYQQQQQLIEQQARQDVAYSTTLPPLRGIGSNNTNTNHSSSRESSYNRFSYTSRGSRESGASKHSSQFSVTSRRRLYADQKSNNTMIDTSQLYPSPLPPSPPRRYASPNPRDRMLSAAAAAAAVSSAPNKPSNGFLDASVNNTSSSNPHRSSRTDTSPRHSRLQKLASSRQIPAAPLLKDVSDPALVKQWLTFDLSKPPAPPSQTIEPPPPLPLQEDYWLELLQQQKRQNRQQRRFSEIASGVNDNNSPNGTHQEQDEPTPDFERGLTQFEIEIVVEKKSRGELLLASKRMGRRYSAGGALEGSTANNGSNTTISTNSFHHRTQSKYNEVECVACLTRLYTSKTTIAVQCPKCSFVFPATSITSSTNTTFVHSLTATNNDPEGSNSNLNDHSPSSYHPRLQRRLSLS